ncbi:MAG TPA: STAS domain-containing protein [Acidimicrobiales bacterium]|jgi:anti-anti-sigma factor|nr:STAS domain-containing protein [Acidimicrobiales bacterium]
MHNENRSDLVDLDRSGIPGYLDFAVSVDGQDEVATVTVTGDLDCYSAATLRTILWALVDDRLHRVVVDLGGTNFIDSTGLGVLVGGARRFRQAGGDMVLRSPTPATRRLFEITGVTKLFEIVYV